MWFRNVYMFINCTYSVRRFIFDNDGDDMHINSDVLL